MKNEIATGWKVKLIIYIKNGFPLEMATGNVAAAFVIQQRLKAFAPFGERNKFGQFDANPRSFYANRDDDGRKSIK